LLEGPHQLTIEVTDRSGQKASAKTAPFFVVKEARQPSYSPTDRLLVDALFFYGGESFLQPFEGELERGQKLRVDARVGGVKQAVDWELRLRSARGAWQHRFARATFAAMKPEERHYVSGEVVIDKTLAPGRYSLELEVREGDWVSNLYRQIVVR
jgi:hypothetical protein